MRARVALQPFAKGSVVVVICLAALLAGVSWGFGRQSGSAAGPVLTIEAPSEVAVGEPIEVRLLVEDANGISGYDATIAFNTAIAHLESIRPQENDLTRLGRDVQGLGPVEVSGGVAVGAYSCPFSDCTDVGNQQRNNQDGTGLIRLTTFTIVADQTGPLTIDLSSARFTDRSGQPVEVDRSNASVTVQVGNAGRGN